MKRTLLHAPGLLSAVLLTFVAACSTIPNADDAEPRPGATVEIDNQGFADVRVYAVRNTERIRLGSVPGLTTRTLAIPHHLTIGMPVRFVAEPMASNARPTTHEISVNPGDQLRLIIRP